MYADLVESCKQILQRLKQENVAEFSCVLCNQHVRGQDALMHHLIIEHKIHCIHFDNVVDLPALLGHLSHLLHRSDAAPSHWTCPVCGDDVGSADVDVLLQHTQHCGHARWNPNSIPSLAPWCVVVWDNSDNSSQEKAEEYQVAAKLGHSSPVDKENSAVWQAGLECVDDDDDDAAWDAMEDEEMDEDEDWNLGCVCLFCDYAGEDVLEHLKSVHNFDFRSAVRQRADVKSEYDLIRIVNAVRRAVATDRCPHSEDCAVDGKHNDRAALEAHLLSAKEHRLPARVSEGDADLIPVLPGDAFLSMLVTSNEGFLEADEEDPDFPMVPTVQELAAARGRRIHTQNEKN